MLELRDLDVYYGAIHALKGVSLHVDGGEIVTMIGANGAGKTTTLRTVSGLLRPRRGSIHFNGEPIHNMSAERIVALGLAHSPEGRQVFANLTVSENLDMGAYLRRDRERVRHDLQRVYDLFPRLHERRRQRAGTMSGGEQQMLAIGRALMTEPKLLMLDEPSLGLAPVLVDSIFATIREINNEGVTVLLVEQNARKALEVADRGYVLETGRVILEGPADDLAVDPKVKKAYLGGH